MPIQINAPEVEQRLHKEAARRGVTATEFALQILLRYLPVQEETQPQETQTEDEPTVEAPFYATASKEEWLRRFRSWINSHPQREPLPPEAFERASFYEEQPA